MCKYCGAKKWQGETPGMCCNGGKVKLEVLHAPPEMLKKLLTEDTSDAKHFRQNLWKYNTAFAMTSFGGDKDLTNRGFFTTYKVQGQVYHLLGSLLPLPEETPKFLQVYFINTSDDEAKHRCSLNSGGRMNIIQQLQDMHHQSHPYVASFKYALEQMQTPNHKVVINAELMKSMHQSSYSGTLIHLDSASIWPMHLGRFPNWSEVSTEVGLCQRGECPVAQEEPELMKSMHQSSYSGTLIHLDSATAPGWPLPAGAVPSCSIQSIDNTIIQKLMCML